MEDALSREINIGDLVLVRSSWVDFYSCFALVVGDGSCFISPLNDDDESYGSFLKQIGKKDMISYPNDADDVIKTKYYKVCRDFNRYIWKVRKEWNTIDSLSPGDILETKNHSVGIFLGNVNMDIAPVDESKKSGTVHMGGLCFVAVTEALKYNCLLKDNIRIDTNSLIDCTYSKEKGLELIQRADALDARYIRELLLKARDNKVYGLHPNEEKAPKISVYNFSAVDFSKTFGHIDVINAPVEWGGTYNTAHGEFRIDVANRALTTMQDYFKEKGLS